jgi:hypothetical protein
MVIYRADGVGEVGWYGFSYQELQSEFEKFCGMSDEEFAKNLPAAAHSETHTPDEVREKFFDRCLKSIENTWKSSTPGFIEGSHDLTHWAGSGKYLRHPQERTK